MKDGPGRLPGPASATGMHQNLYTQGLREITSPLQ